MKQDSTLEVQSERFNKDQRPQEQDNRQSREESQLRGQSISCNEGIKKGAT